MVIFNEMVAAVRPRSRSEPLAPDDVLENLEFSLRYFPTPASGVNKVMNGRACLALSCRRRTRCRHWPP